MPPFEGKQLLSFFLAQHRDYEGMVRQLHSERKGGAESGCPRCLIRSSSYDCYSCGLGLQDGNAELPTHSIDEELTNDFSTERYGEWFEFEDDASNSSATHP
eukprot:2494426-Karenia_brevis.AAC.1